jgi:hypothetical protein
MGKKNNYESSSSRVKKEELQPLVTVARLLSTIGRLVMGGATCTYRSDGASTPHGCPPTGVTVRPGATRRDPAQE